MKLLIFEMRSKRKITLRELEKMTGISRSTLSRYEKSGNEDANIKNIEKIAKVFNCKMTDLFESEYK